MPLVTVGGGQLLSANDQSIETDALGWGSYNNVTKTRDSTHASVGTWALKLVPTVSNPTSCRAGLNTAVATAPSRTYTLSMAGYSSVTLASVRIEVDWYTAIGGAYISSYLGSDRAMTQNAFVTFTETNAIAPDAAAAGFMIISMRGTYTTASNFWFDAMSFVDPGGVNIAPAVFGTLG